MDIQIKFVSIESLNFERYRLSNKYNPENNRTIGKQQQTIFLYSVSF